LTKSFNKGIDIAKGNYIARIDAEDWWDKRKLEKQITFLEKNKDYVLCGARTVFMDEEGYFLEQTKEADFLHPSIIFRNRKIYYRDFFKCSQDFDLYLRLSLLGKFYRLSKPLTFCQISFSSSLSINKRYYARQYQKIAYDLFKERLKFGKDALDRGKAPAIKESKVGLKLCSISNLFFAKYVRYRISKKNYFLGTMYLFLSLSVYPPLMIEYWQNKLRKGGLF